MTSNVKLLPLPELPVAVERFILSSLGPMKREGAVTALRTMLREYALANMEPLIAEIKGMRTEREVIVAEALRYVDKSGSLEAKVDRLAEALKDLEVCANTIGFCYTRNPGNFAVALRELRESAERSRDALRDSESASA